MTNRYKVLLTAFMLFAVIITACYSKPDNEPGARDIARNIRMPRGIDAVADAVEKIGPSVVFLNVESVQKLNQIPNPFSNDPFFRQFFGNIPDEIFKYKKGQGSGVIIDSDGYILTNQHVVGGARKITVTLTDGRKFPGSLVGVDPVTDIALVRIDAENLPVAKIGNSEKIRVGEWVIAVGNPFGYENTVTVGVLSGRGRRLADITRQYEGLLQTDAAINPGNSGGPLCDLEGKVIGINTAMIPYGQGIGFAIPIETAMEITDILMKKGCVERAYLGIMMTNVANLEKQALEHINFNGKEGIVITRVFPGSPAELAGLRPGDVIIEVDGKKITDVEQMRRYVLSCVVGKKISIVVMRSGVRNNLTATLAKRPDEL
ncbi:MAG: trypsin-like peptidase domain-containing protein [Candidatus Eremiobacteraeota bacterium]|nr:trypsin-like peptidase domain-containing protein [Candidatus Eremiobacteraeota bacterium]